MKSATWILASLMLAVGACRAEDSKTADGLRIEGPMPARDIAMMNIDGRMLTLNDVAGKNGTLVIFSCNHCPFVQAWHERMTAIGNDSRKKEIGVVFINSNDPAEFPTDDLAHMKKQAEDAGYEFPYVMDEASSVARAFGAGRTPEIFLFDAKQNLVYHGAVDDNAYKPEKVGKYYLSDAISAILSGKPVPVAETKSVGCSIKFSARKAAPETSASEINEHVLTQEITYRDGDQTLKGYMALDPSKKVKLPGVIVVHEWYGLNDYAKSRTRELATMGYVALAADMYGDGKVAKDRSEAAKLAGQLRSDRALMRRRAAAALEILKTDSRVDPARIFAIGYCFGGGCVLELARSGAELAGVVSFHGNLDTPDREATKKPCAAILVCHGAADPHVTVEHVAAFQEEMNGCGADWQLNMYGGAAHAFSNPEAGNDPSTGAAYDAAADRRSREDMLLFFGRTFM